MAARIGGEARGALGLLASRVNADWHGRALWIFGAIVGLHWAEHVVQSAQIWLLHYHRADARGLFGTWWPWLVTSEWLHYGFALVLLAGLVALLPGFRGLARRWWWIALVIQLWHFLEHLFLFVQAQTGVYWFGAAVPTSVVQFLWPGHRPELHLVYNTLVTVPLVVALWVRAEQLRPARASNPVTPAAVPEA